LVTSNDGTRFPDFMQFDKVLCDVPCTGDGTVRKNPGSSHILYYSYLEKLGCTNGPLIVPGLGAATIKGLTIAESRW
jgi:hypothetical protein